MTTPALLVLEDGSLFKGTAIGALGQACGEVVFNTSMTGYQEILTDPSYARQIVTLTHPHIGNTGVNQEDAESTSIWAAGLVIREAALLASSWRNQQPLGEYLKANNTVAIANIDTRRLTRILRQKGAQNGCILAGDNISVAQALSAAKRLPGLKGVDLAKQVCTAKPYQWQQSVWRHGVGYSRPALQKPFKVVVYDFGVKHNILRMLVERNCQLTVVPAETPASEVLLPDTDGVFLSNGPGDPEPCTYAIEAIQTILVKGLPVFGICLGHQLLALASGAQTEKMKFGHHGANHPVQNLATAAVMITSQNHSFTVVEASLPQHLRATHRSLFDGSLQGIERIDKPAFSFQGHPEASPGPRDVAPLFDRFITNMCIYRK